MIKTRLIIFITILITIKVEAQLLEDKEFFPGVKSIKSKYGKGYWTLEVLDSLGRVSIEENYKKLKLLTKGIYTYNSQNDKVLYVAAFDRSSPSRIDSIIYEYKYNQFNVITYQHTIYSQYTSSLIELIEEPNDTTKSYRYTSKYYRPDIDSIIGHTETYTLIHNSKGEIGSFQHRDPKANKVIIFNYVYYPNGKLKRRMIERIPKPEVEGVYVGGPGSDDMSYKYRYDTKGRVKRMYAIVYDRMYKMVSYQYKD